MFKRIIGLAKPHWLLLSASILASIVFVFFNSLSIWLTASFISNILIDFDTLVGIQKELITSNERTANETLKMLTNKLGDLEAKISLVKNNDLDYLDMLYREKFRYGTKDEIIIKLK